MILILHFLFSFYHVGNHFLIHISSFKNKQLYHVQMPFVNFRYLTKCIYVCNVIGRICMFVCLFLLVPLISFMVLITRRGQTMYTLNLVG